MAASLGRSSAVFAVMTLASRVLGLLRDMLVARYFDAVVTDAFYAALRIPNTLRRFFAEGSFANAFVPVFSATRTEHPEELKDLLRHTSGTLLGILLAVTALGVIFSSTVIALVASGLSERPDQYLLASDMLRLMFPYILLISLTAMAGGVLNTFGQFGIPALTPVLLNIPLIAANDVSLAMGGDDNQITLIDKHGETALPKSGKDQAAAAIVGRITHLLEEG